MGASPISSSSSLDRLKVLDTLPDLASQLQEAKRLCDHRARAEMILKWLMAKLKTSDEARQNESSWNLLELTVRLVPAQRIAVLCSGLMLALQQTWAAHHLDDATVYAIARFFRVLLELGKGSDGTAIKSMLSVKGDTSAIMCGDWYRHVYRNFFNEGKIAVLAKESLLEPAMKLWELRKHKEDDDTSFNNHCLVPILLLLASLRKSTTFTSVKRKRGHETAIPASARSYEYALEALMAKHTILPARTVFNRKHEQQPRRMPHGQQKLTLATIKERLSALKDVIASGTFENATIDSLWLVLDVAMRSVSTPTPRHRLAERSWIETMLTAISDCVSSQSRQVVNHTLVELLETIRRNGAGHTALSTQMLTDLLKRHAIAEAANEETVDWHLIAKIVELDADVLMNNALTEELFNAISDNKDQQSSALNTLLRDGIVVPTMKAYARGRSLASFVDIWHKQLLRPRVEKDHSVWESLSGPFADILEEYVLADQIVAQIDRFSLPVRAAVDEQSKLTNEETASALIASIIMLEALLGGSQSDDLVSSLQDRLDALLHCSIDLANHKGFKTAIGSNCHYWGLLMRAFQSWFPFWATKQDGVAAVESEGMALLTSKAFKNALTRCSASENDQELQRAARAFVASLCACLQHYGGEQGCAGLCRKAMENVVQHEAGAASVLVRRQALLSTLEPGPRKKLLSSTLTLATDATYNAQEMSTSVEALLSSSHGLGRQQVSEDMVSIMIAHLNGRDAGLDVVKMISTLANMDPLSIEQAQRIEILDAVSQLGEVRANQDGAATIQARFALLLKFLALPCQNAQLLADAARLWKLASLLTPEAKADGLADSSLQLDSLANVQLLENTARCVLKSLLATQDSQKSQTALVELSQLIKDGVKQGAKSKKLSAHTGQLALIKIAIAMLEASGKDDIKSRLVYRASKTVKSYLDALMAECSAHLGEKGARFSTAQSKCVISALQALLDAPDSLVALSGVDTADHTKGLYKIARECMSSARVPDDALLRSGLLVVCFQLICRHASGKKNLTTVAEDILEHGIQARDLVTILLAYEGAFRQADVEWKLIAITALTKDRSVEQNSTLLLQQSILRALSKEDAEAVPSAKDIVLHALKAASSPGTPLPARRTALQSMALIFKDKPFLTTQYTIEQTLSGLQALFASIVSPDIGTVYLSICNVLTVILAQHRSRLQGRFHLVVGILQQLISHLFSDGTAEIRQARSLAKLLESFCHPPALRYRKGGKPSELVDEAKKAQAHAGQFAQYLLHFYCSCVLTGSLGEGVREVLLPGLWAVIEAMEAYNEEGIKVLSSAANNSERAVLRSVYEDWKRFGKWEGV